MLRVLINSFAILPLTRRIILYISVQKHVYAAQEDQLEQKKLDVATDVAEAYFNVLRAQTFERIRQENVKRSQRYLELARIRVSIGIANKGEVYRWESQIASNLKDLISANAQGMVSIVDLLDGQTQARIAQEAATDVLFDYLLRIMQVQRAAGEFDFFRNKKENDDFKLRLTQYIAKGPAPTNREEK